jgi:hypothetical protein
MMVPHLSKPLTPLQQLRCGYWVWIPLEYFHWDSLDFNCMKAF